MRKYQNIKKSEKEIRIYFYKLNSRIHKYVAYERKNNTRVVDKVSIFKRLKITFYN